MATWKTVQKIATKLPETEETTSHGNPAFKVKGTKFVGLREDVGYLTLYTEEKAALIAADPSTFFSTPHHDGYPIVLVHIKKVREKRLRELLAAAWRMRAPAKVRKTHPEI